MAEEEEEERRSKARVVAFLSLVGLVITVLAGGTSLVFSLRPGLRPCLEESAATFTGAPVFPRTSYHAHLLHKGEPRDEVAAEPNPLGAEVRFSYQIDDLRGTALPLYWSLVSVERDGTVGAIDPTQDRLLAMTVTPDSCTETGGNDLFVLIPAPGKRYRVVLELYRDASRDERIALTQSAVFRG
jgi:hypothetical protein